MDSINKQQPEKNHEDLKGQEATKKIKDLVDSAKTCFFCTSKTGEAFATRPMAVQKVDDDGNLWFLSATDSHKNEELQTDSKVQLLFQGSSYDDFLNIEGKATVSKDKAKIKELWEPILKTWFTEGIDDPRISVIKVEPTGGYYWDTKHGKMIEMLKMAAALVTGTSMDDGIEGMLQK